MAKKEVAASTPTESTEQPTEQPKQIVREITVRKTFVFNDAELERRTEQATGLVAEISGIKDAIKAHAKAERARAAEKRREYRRLLKSVEHGQERLAVQCNETLNFSAGTYTLGRIDTGAIFIRRRLTSAECQLEISGPGGNGHESDAGATATLTIEPGEVPKDDDGIGEAVTAAAKVTIDAFGKMTGGDPVDTEPAATVPAGLRL